MEHADCIFAGDFPARRRMAAEKKVGGGVNTACLRARLGILALLAALPLQATTFYLTVAGLGGEPDYEQRFKMLADETDKLLKSGGPDRVVVTLEGLGATRAAVLGALGKFAQDAKSADSLVVMLIGHGTFDGVEYKINLPGPDLSGGDLAAALNRVPAARQLVVNMTSASGG